MIRSLFVFFSTLLLTYPGYAISRAGNGKITSALQGFTLEIPNTFNQLEFLENDSIRIKKTPILGFTDEFSDYSWSNFLKPLIIEIHPLKEKYPELNGLTKKEFIQIMQERKMNSMSNIQTSDCLEVWTRSNESAHFGFVKWNSNNGYLIFGTQTEQIIKVIEKIILSTSINLKDCQWNP